MPSKTILWRRLDRSGHEWARLDSRGSDWCLEGTAVFAHEGKPCRSGFVTELEVDPTGFVTLYPRFWKKEE